MPVIAVVNQKGGVGKTSFTYHMAGAMAETMGMSVLVIDNDAQANLTLGFWGLTRTEGLDPDRTVASILRGDEPHRDTVIHPTGLRGIDIIPSSSVSASHNTTEPWRLYPGVQLRYRDFLYGVARRYDYVLIDCPPSMQFRSWVALAASDFMVIPVQPESFGAIGIRTVIKFMGRVQSFGYPVQLLGLAISMMSARSKIHRGFEEALRNEYRDKVLQARLKYLTDFNHAISIRRPIHYYKPQSEAAKDISNMANELEGRVDAMLRNEAAA